MKKSIFNIYVPITSQEQADRLKQVCLDNGLPIELICNLWIVDKMFKYFLFDVRFSISCSKKNKQQSTEAEFMELLKQWKDENS